MSQPNTNRTDFLANMLDPVEREAQSWVIRFASGEATTADLQAGKLWCEQSPAHAAAFSRASRLWDRLGPSVFTANLRPDLRPQSQMTRRAVLGGALAASVAGAAYIAVRPPLGLWPSWSELTADYRTETGEQRQITVADDVAIEMNTQTSIVVRQAGAGDGRIDLISGEALIATSSGAAKIFVVASGGGQVRALKAKFNVRYDGRLVCVTCLDGSVSIEHQAATVSLGGRQQVIYDQTRLGTVTEIDPATVTAWQDGVLIFHATPLSRVIDEVNRYRPGKIILVNAELGGRLLSANFHIRNVGDVIGQAERLFGATVTSLPGGIVLLS